MTEADNSLEKPKIHTSRHAVIALLLLIPVIVVIFAIFCDPSIRFHIPYFVNLCMGILVMASFILIAVSLDRFGQSDSRSGGGILVLSTMGLCLLTGLTTVLVSLKSGHPAYTRCWSQLHALKVGLDMYAAANEGNYPVPNKWCDLIFGDDAPYVRKDALVCPVKFRQEQCSYALNPNAHPNSPPDTVLIFETQGGWNKFGGPELLSIDNHQKKHWLWGYRMSGCNILFNSGESKFVTQKHFDDLKWKTDANDN